MRVAAAVAAAAIIISGLATPAPVGAADGADPVAYVTVSPETTAAHGLIGGQEVGIWATVHEPRGAITGNRYDPWPFLGVIATVERTAGGPHQSVTVRLPTTGAPDAFYGALRVASTWVGTWTLTRLSWTVNGVVPASVEPQVAIPGATRSFTVVGTDIPTISAVRIPRVAAYGARQWVQYTVRTSAGAPAAGLAVRFAFDTSCSLPQVPAAGHPALRTDATGRVTIPLSGTSGPVYNLGLAPFTTPCVDIWSRPIWTTSPETAAVLARLAPTRYEYYKWVSAVPTAAAVRVNRTLTVIGSAYPGRGVVRLQRLVGRTWRTVASARIRTSGRYTIYGLVTVLGRNYFRVVALNGDPTLAPTPSRVVVVTGTRRCDRAEAMMSLARLRAGSRPAAGLDADNLAERVSAERAPAVDGGRGT